MHESKKLNKSHQGKHMESHNCLSNNQTLEGRDHKNERKRAFIQNTTKTSYKCIFKPMRGIAS